MFKHYDRASKWAFIAYSILLAIHIFVFIFALLTLNSANEAGDWGAVFATIFGLFFLGIGALVTMLVGIAFVFFLFSIHPSHPESFIHKLAKIYNILVLLGILMYGLGLLIGGFNQPQSQIWILALPIILPSGYLLYYTFRKKHPLNS